MKFLILTWQYVKPVKMNGRKNNKLDVS